jgi:uncharacterized protein RhaS with RHS repeats
VLSEDVNDGSTIHFSYDRDGLLAGAGALVIDRDPATGFITGTTLGIVTDQRTYDEFGAIATYSARVSGTPVYEVVYSRDALGRIVAKTETIEGTTTIADRSIASWMSIP